MKKNQFALIFLTALTMLAVWYFKSPNKQDESNTIPVSGVVYKTDKLDNMREAVRNERSNLLNTLNDVIADEKATLVSKTNAIEQRDNITTLNECEALVETKIVNLGYEDAFVHSTDLGIEVVVLCDEPSGNSALEIIDLVNETFNKNDSVVVNFQNLK